MAKVSDLKIRTDEYWIKRFEALTKAMYDLGDDAIPTNTRLYNRTAISMSNKVDDFYRKYGKIQNSPTFKTLPDGTQVISGTTSKLVVPKSVADVRVKGGTRLTKLQDDIRGDLVDMSKAQNLLMKDQFGEMATEAYYNTFYELHRGYGVGTSFNLLDPTTVNQLITNPVNGQNFSTRVWHNRDLLANRVNQTLTDGIITGISNREMAKRLTDMAIVKPGGSKSEMQKALQVANRLIRTEVTNTYNQANLRGYKDSGMVKQYEYLATLDNRTSDICTELDGQVFDVEKAVTGLNFPPMHVNCRSTTVAHFDNSKEGLTRIARDLEGNTFVVPATMTAKEYKKIYVNNVADITPNKTVVKSAVKKVKKPIVVRPKKVPAKIPKVDKKTVSKKVNKKIVAPEVTKKWVITDGRNILTSFDVKKDARAYGMSQRGKGNTVFLESKVDYLKFKPKDVK